MTQNPWVAPGSAPPPEPARPDPTAPPSDAVPPPSYAVPPPSYAAPPPGYAAPPPGYAAPQPPAGPRPPAYAGLEFRPGIIPLRPLGLGDIYGAVTKAVRGNVAATMGLALLTSLVCIIPFTALGAWVANQETLDFESEEFGAYGVIGSYLPTIGSLLASIALTGFLAYVIGQAVLGRKVGIGETWEGTKRRLPALSGAVLLTLIGAIAVTAVILGGPIALAVSQGFTPLTGILIFLAVLALVVTYLFLWTRTAFVTSVIVLEGRGAFNAFARSWRLTSGTPFWRILGIRLLTSIIVSTVAQVIVFPLALFGVLGIIALGGEEQIFMWQAILGGVSGLISAVITTPFSAGVDALLTVDQRIRREGLDVQLIHTAQHGGPAPWPSAVQDR
jgi:hypothetical protein